MLNMMLLMLIVVLTLFLALIIHRYFSRDERVIAELPGPLPVYPLIGNLNLFCRFNKPLNHSVFHGLRKLAAQYRDEGLFRINIGPSALVAVFRADLVDEILSSNSLTTKGLEYAFLSDWLGESIGIAHTDSWRKKRKILMPAFNTTIINESLPIVNEQAQVLVHKIYRLLGDQPQQEEGIEIRHLISLCIFDINYETSMGVSVNVQANPSHEILINTSRMCELVMERVWAPWLWNDRIYSCTRRGREWRRVVDSLHSFTSSVLEKRKRQLTRPEKGTRKLAFLDLLLKAHREGLLDEKSVREEVDEFTFAGHDTTSVALVWTLFELGNHTAIQARVQEELDSHFGAEQLDEHITKDRLNSLPYMDRVIKECLRLYPVAPQIARHVTQDIRLGRHLVPKGCSLWILIDELHRDARHFPQPGRFDPDRFLPERVAPLPPSAYAPFSGGPRSCMGSRLAIVEMKVVLSHLLRHFSVESVTQREAIKAVMEIVYRPKSPVVLRFRPRNLT